MHGVPRAGSARRDGTRPYRHPRQPVHRLPQARKPAGAPVPSTPRQPERGLPVVPRERRSAAVGHDPSRGSCLLALPPPADDRAAGTGPRDGARRSRLPDLPRGGWPGGHPSGRSRRAAGEPLPDLSRGEDRKPAGQHAGDRGLAGAVEHAAGDLRRCERRRSGSTDRKRHGRRLPATPSVTPMR